LTVTDARLLASQVDGTIIVVESGKTRTEAFLRACEALDQANANIIGVVLNKTRHRDRRYYSYYRRRSKAVEAVANTNPTSTRTIDQRLTEESNV
jgi:Mrp family chromosome partitioning ATPase